MDKTYNIIKYKNYFYYLIRKMNNLEKHNVLKFLFIYILKYNVYLKLL